MSRKTQCLDNCNALANQYMVLVAIFASLLSQEIEDDEDLGILGSFLIALGEELSLASEIRILCKSKLEKNKNNIDTEIIDTFDRTYIKRKKVKKFIKK